MEDRVNKNVIYRTFETHQRFITPLIQV